MSVHLHNIYNKIAVSVFSLLFAVMLGMPLLLVAFVNFILQVMMLVIALFLPISFVIAILPSFANSGWYTLGRLFGVAGMKIFAGILLLFTFMIVNITQEVVPSASTEMYMLNAIITSVLLILMIKYRNKMIEFITAGKVASVDMQASNRAYQKVIRDPAQKTAHRLRQGTQVAMAYAGARRATSAYQERQSQRTSQAEASQSDKRGARVVDFSGYQQARKQRTPQAEPPPAPHGQKDKQTKGSAATKKQTYGKAYMPQERNEIRTSQPESMNDKRDGSEKQRKAAKPQVSGSTGLSEEKRKHIRQKYNIRRNKPITRWEAQQQVNDQYEAKRVSPNAEGSRTPQRVQRIRKPYTFRRMPSSAKTETPRPRLRLGETRRVQQSTVRENHKQQM